MAQKAVKKDIANTLTRLKELDTRAVDLMIEDENGEPEYLTFELKSISVGRALADGTIPNELLQEATHMMTPDGKVKQNAKVTDSTMIQSLKTIDAVCKMVMVTPKYEEAEPFLTDDLKLQIYTFAQEGARALKRFHTQKTRVGRGSNSK